MSEEFHIELKRVREESRFPRRLDFIERCQMDERNYRRFEAGENVPSEATLEKILVNCFIPEAKAKKLRHLANIARARKLGVRMPQTMDVNVSDLAEKIQRELEFELRRTGVKVTPRTRKVCLRRIEIILKNEVGES